jgi:hypothetical protein
MSIHKRAPSLQNRTHRLGSEPSYGKVDVLAIYTNGTNTTVVSGFVQNNWQSDTTYSYMFGAVLVKTLAIQDGNATVTQANFGLLAPDHYYSILIDGSGLLHHVLLDDGVAEVFVTAMYVAFLSVLPFDESVRIERLSNSDNTSMGAIITPSLQAFDSAVDRSVVAGYTLTIANTSLNAQPWQNVQNDNRRKYTCVVHHWGSAPNVFCNLDYNPMSIRVVSTIYSYYAPKNESASVDSELTFGIDVD